MTTTSSRAFDLGRRLWDSLRLAFRRKPSPGDTLRALTLAALALPGVMQPARAAEGDELNVQVAHYQEGERNLQGPSYADLNLRPIRVDSLATSMRFGFFDRWRFGLAFTQDTWSGATPVATLPQAAVFHQLLSGASIPTGYFSDAHHNPITVNWESYDGTHVDTTQDPKLVHLMASASAETRKQVDLELGREWSEAALKVGVGVSDERDYHSRSIGMSGTRDFARKLTTLSWGWRYTRSEIDAAIDANEAADWGAYLDEIRLDGGVSTLFASRQDASVNVGLTRVLSKEARLDLRLGYTRGTGFLENPYKAVMLAFDDPGQDTGGLVDVREVVLKGVLEQRPDLRGQWTWNTRYVRHIDRFDAAVHLEYRFFRDDWGIRAHTLEVAWDQPIGHGWLVTPSLRDYTQTAAYFYQPYFFFLQAYPTKPGTLGGLDHSQLRIDAFSSDQRLSGFGAFSGGVTFAKRFRRGLAFELGYEAYRHAGSLKWGGGGEGDYADFKSYTVHAALRADLAAPGSAGGGVHHDHGAATGQDDHSQHASPPAGVLVGHSLSHAGDLMIGYRFMSARQGGAILNGSSAASASAIIEQGCGVDPCYLEPTEMSMSMHMLDIMYAPTGRLTLMVMPQFIDMEMGMRAIDGAPPPPDTGHQHGGGSHDHATGGLGDTGLFALFHVADLPAGSLVGSLGLSVPTGNAQVKLNGSEGFLHYGMQLGSGTWDGLLGLTYAGKLERWSWGAQLGGVKRLEQRNRAGYALGDVFQTTVWGGYGLSSWLSATVRGVYTVQGPIRGEFVPHWDSVRVGQVLQGTELVPVYERVLQTNPVLGPMDSPASYGGRFWDVGLGLDAVVRTGALKGNRLSVEWLQPVKDDTNGFQLRRQGALVIAWSLGFGT